MINIEKKPTQMFPTQSSGCLEIAKSNSSFYAE